MFECQVCGSVTTEKAEPAAMVVKVSPWEGYDLSLRMATLIDLFPGLRPWKTWPKRPHHFDGGSFHKWAVANCFTESERDAARFVLMVWNSDFPMGKLGRFNVVDAVHRWDREHREAFVTFSLFPFGT